MSENTQIESNPLQTILEEFPRQKPSPAHDMDQEEVLRVLELAE